MNLSVIKKHLTYKLLPVHDSTGPQDALNIDANH